MISSSSTSRRLAALLWLLVASSSFSSSFSFSLAKTTTTTTTKTTKKQNNKQKPSPQILRALEEGGYEYLEDLSGYQMQFGKCVRVKVPEDGDDEGNSYFYNGHYYAQGQQFASVYLCTTESNTMCGTCDTSKEYVIDLATYLETTLDYAQDMCDSCEAKCYNNRRRQQRKLEEDEEGDEGNEEQEGAGEEEEAAEEEGEAENLMNVDCSTCVNICSHMSFHREDDEENGDENNNYDAYNTVDETLYLDCQEAFQDANGYDIYVGPQCNADGDITIGFYYDNECTVKSSSQEMDFGFEYGTFHGLQTMCMDCNPYNNGEDEVCQGLYEGSTHCSNGRNLNNNNGGEDEDMPICKTYEKAHKEHIYGKHPREWRIVETLVAVVLIGGLMWVFLTLSYTYYLRHRNKSANSSGEGKGAPLTEHDYHTEPEVTVTSSSSSKAPSDLPPMA